MRHSGVPRHVSTECRRPVPTGNSPSHREDCPPHTDAGSERQPPAYLHGEQGRVVDQMLRGGLEEQPRIAHDVAWARHSPPSAGARRIDGSAKSYPSHSVTLQESTGSHTGLRRSALESAKVYQEEMAMSPDAIHDQLTSEYGGQFTQEEADYAIENL